MKQPIVKYIVTANKVLHRIKYFQLNNKYSKQINDVNNRDQKCFFICFAYASLH